jgi:hypothetical protein
MVSGDRNGTFNLFIADSARLTAFYAESLANGDSFDVGGNSQPAVTDWDLDGRKDLLLGSEEGYVRLYLNVATDTWPKFQDFSYVQADGSPIYYNRVNPYVVDLDGDGRRDLICGANDGYVYFFRNTGSDTNPTFAAAETVKSEAGTPIMPTGTAYGSRLDFCDWNNDGWTDVLISGYDGLVELWLGGAASGTAERRSRALPVSLSVGPNPACSQVSIRFSLPQGSEVRLAVIDAAGREAATLFSGRLAAGAHSLQWTADCPAGVYVCRLTAGSQVLTRRVIVLD